MTYRLPFVLGVVAASWFCGGSAFAEERPEEHDDEDARVEHRWYGAQTLMADGVSLGLAGSMFVADYAEPTPALFAAGMISYALVPPIIHMAHGHIGKGFGDFGIRLGAAVTGAAVGFILGGMFWTPPPVSNEPSPITGFVYPIAATFSLFDAQVRGAALGTFVGGAIAAVVDGTALARDEVPRPGTRITDRQASIVPTLGPTPNGFNAGVAGTF